MPINKVLGIKSQPSRGALFYLVFAFAIVILVYYIPDYFFLEKITADHVASILNAFGINVQSRVNDHQAFINDIRIIRDCTGIQVVSVFLGLIIPLPKAPFKKKILTLSILCVFIYVANALRITLEFWLVYEEILPWSLAHYPLSLILGVIGVFSLVIVTEQLMPEFGDFICHLAKKK